MDHVHPSELEDGRSGAGAEKTSRASRFCCRTALAWAVALTGVHLGLALPHLTSVPRAITDESWEACTGYSLAYDGQLRNPVIYRYGIERAFVQPRITQSFVLAGAYRMLGVSLHSGRLASVLVGWAAVIGVFYLMRTWLSYGASGLIALLVAVDTQFFLVTRTVRPEVYVLCVSVWMLAMLARGTVRPSFRRCFGAGLIGGVGCYTHPNTVLVIVPSLLLIVYAVGFRRQLLSALAGYALGGMVAVLPFFAYVAYAQAHHQVSFVEQLGSFYTSLAEQGTSNPLMRELRRWWSYFRPLERGPWVLLVAAGVVWGAVRRHPLQVWALILTLGHALLVLILIKSASPRYLVVLSPWFAAFVGVFVLQWWEWARTLTPAKCRAMRALAVLCVCGTFALHLAGSAYVSHAYRQADYDAVCRRIRHHIPSGSRIYGNLVFWTGLYQYPYLSEITYPQQPRVDQIVPVMRDRLGAFAPQFVVRSSFSCHTLDGLGPRRAEFNRDTLRSPSYELIEAIQTRFCDRYIARHLGVLLDRFTTRDFGTIEIYRLDW